MPSRDPGAVSSRDSGRAGKSQGPRGLLDAVEPASESADARLSAAFHGLRDGEGWFRRFALERVTDETGLSGVGIVAVGVALPSGRLVMQWRTTAEVGPGSLAIYDSLAQLVAIHGHAGATVVRWVDRVEPIFLLSSLAERFAPASGDRVGGQAGAPVAAAG